MKPQISLAENGLKRIRDEGMYKRMILRFKEFKILLHSILYRQTITIKATTKEYNFTVITNLFPIWLSKDLKR